MTLPHGRAAVTPVNMEAFRREMEALGAEYRGSLPARLAKIDALWHELAHGAAEPARLTELQRELHTIAGSAKTFGIANVSEAAAAAESLLEPHCARGRLPGRAAREKLALLLDALRQAAA